jgi:hypothetical protein
VILARCCFAARGEAATYSLAVRAEVERLTKRRDAIAAQLASLRDVVSGFGEDDS